MPTREAISLGGVRVFISSSSEDGAVHLRDRAESLITLVNRQLDYANIRLQLMPVRWEDVAAQKSPAQGTNELFVTLVRESALTLVLFVRDLRSGTKEELLAALGETEVQVAVLFFPPDGEPDNASQELRFFLQQIRDKVLFNACADAYSPEASDCLTRVLLSEIFKRLAPPQQEPLYETR